MGIPVSRQNDRQTDTTESIILPQLRLREVHIADEEIWVDL